MLIKVIINIKDVYKTKIENYKEKLFDYNDNYF